MRVRKKKHGEERLLACQEFLYESKGKPVLNPAKEIFGKDCRPFYLEIGAGKGSFAVETVKAEENIVYLALERVTDCIVLAAEKAKAERVDDRLRFIIDTADNLTSILGNGTVDKIFLNFSDPWSKKGYAKRRLTHRRYLSVYLNLLKDGGTLRFKTDNVGLFDFSLEEIEAIGLTPLIVTRDLHTSPYAEGNVVTEYEKNFSSQGIKINMLEIQKPKGFSIEISDDLKQDRISYINLHRKEKNE